MAWQDTPCVIGKTKKSIRQLWIKANGPLPYETKVCHFCDNRRCENLNHLWLGTQSENMKDCHKKGRDAGTVYHKGKPLSEEHKKAVSEAIARWWANRKEK